MYSEVYGYRINLVYITILVGLYDLVHILHELKERFYLFQHYENVEQGCFDDLFQAHCLDIYGEVGIYTLDFVFTCFLIYGAKSLKRIPVLAWLLLSTYHLVDLVLMFTPFYGYSYSLSLVPLSYWADVGFSMLGFLYVIYFYKKLVEADRGEIERERLSNVDEMNITGTDLGAY